ncbi:unnamed protein product [Vitrella brassicaformis CCMP3155]|uniref:TRUD domain-containing protein n=1 Tax=Vitrella brassicaformis (strain CCMP3155) TaxID=1169540 RepID=A0A0G4EM57_VITBC|nr:unnamed protein product [Vitrella brassicaformis CCMP3155]|eukprot:CEL98238.1 unnamed protein product [Vitrella brassicaformis CCMP3155]
MDGTTAVRERDAGMTEQLRSHQGFPGVFKHRYEDFHVHEIDLEGRTLWLNDLLDRKAVVDEFTNKGDAEAGRGVDFEAYELSPQAEGAFSSIGVTAASLASLTSFIRSFPSLLHQGLPRDEATQRQIVPSCRIALNSPKSTADGDSGSEPSDSAIKEVRKECHRLVREHLPFINSDTVRASDAASGRSDSLEVDLTPKPALLRALVPRECQVADEQDAPVQEMSDRQKKREKFQRRGGRGRGRDHRGGSSAPSVFQSAGERRSSRAEGKWVQLSLYKENRDTAEAIGCLAQCVGRERKQCGFAGTKDRRAITVQRVAVRGVTIEQIKRAILHRKWDSRLRIGDLSYTNNKICLGDLQGNLFRVVLRGVPPSPNANSPPPPIEQAFEELQTMGFLNYFGLQRFGTSAHIRTHHVGVALLGQQWRRAVRLILGDHDMMVVSEDGADGASEPSAKKRRLDSDAKALGHFTATAYLADESPESAKADLSSLPPNLHIERTLLQQLAADRPLLECLQKLPRHTLSLYVHSVQSLVFNKLLSYRIRVHGKRPVVGDLVGATSAFDSRAERLRRKQGRDGEDENNDADQEEGEDDAQTDENESFAPQDVTPLSTADAAASCSLEQVVLPLPGSSVRYPTILEGEYRRVVKEELGLDLEDFKEIAHMWGNLPGGYRHICVKPRDLKWLYVPKVGDSSVPLLTSAVDRQVGRWRADQTLLPSTNSPAPAGADGAADGPGERQEMARGTGGGDVLDGKGAVIMQCVLPPSAYLTMALRELLAVDTGAAKAIKGE